MNDRFHSARMKSAQRRLAAVVAAAFAFVGPLPALAQFSVDETTGEVGEEVQIGFRNDGTGSISVDSTYVFEGEFKLSDPTVFFPQTFRSVEGVEIVSHTITQVTDSTYLFRIEFRITGQVADTNVLFSLAGEALAGADSVTTVLMHDMTLNGNSVAPIEAVVKTMAPGIPRSYVRFASLDPGRPNPTVTGREVTWGFRIDKRSEVSFRIYDALGQNIATDDLGILERGVYTYSFVPGVEIPSGLYVVRLITNSGEAFQPLHVRQ